MELTDQQEFTIRATSQPVSVVERVVLTTGSGDVQLQMQIDASGWVGADDAIAAPGVNTFVAEPGISYRWSIGGTAAVYVSGANIELSS